MSKLRGEKVDPMMKATGKSVQTSKDAASVYVAPSLDGRDREYVVVFERKAIYKKPSFLL
ncbi:MAG: hypothetical protein ACE3L7_06955 [Candidatus Pristimantibacillus sp.]